MSPVGVSTVESTFERERDCTTAFCDQKPDDVLGDKQVICHQILSYEAQSRWGKQSNAYLAKTQAWVHTWNTLKPSLEGCH